MVLEVLDWAILAGMLLLSLAIGLLVRKKAEGGVANFFLGGRNLPWYIAGISMVATTFAADTPLAVSEMIAQAGISQNWIWWSFLAGGMLTAVFFAHLWRRAEIVTELEFITLRYSGKPARWLRMFKAAYLGLFMNVLVIGWVNVAFNALLQEFFGLEGHTLWIVTLAAMSFAALYSAVSGLLGIALADTIQFVVAMTGSVVLAVFVLDSDQVGGIAGLQATLPEETFSFFPAWGSWEATDVFTLTAGTFAAFALVQWWASWYPGAEPGGGGYIAQRMMSVRSESDSFKATAFFQVAHYCLRPWPWILVGLAALALYSPQYANDPFPQAEQVMTWMEADVSESETMKRLGEIDPEHARQVRFMYQPKVGYLQAMIDFLPVGWRGLLLAAFLSAYLSTISTQLNMGAGFLVNDLWLVARPEERDPKRSLLAARVATVLLMVLGLLVSRQMNSISGVWEFILEAGAGLGAVLILRWFWWRINAWSEITAMVAPFVGYTLGKWVLEPALGSSFADNKGSFLFTVLFTTVCWILVTFRTRPEPTTLLQNFYQRVHPGGWWKPITGTRVDQGSALRQRLGLWLASVVGVYSLLFITGYALFGQWTQVGICAVVLVLCAGLIARWYRVLR